MTLFLKREKNTRVYFKDMSDYFYNRENCEKEAAKVFRKYYRRPYFMPPMTEATEGNWFIVSLGENKTLSVSFLI